MKVHDLLNGVIYAGALAGSLSGIGLFLHFALVRPIRRFLTREITTHLIDIKDSIDQNNDDVQRLRDRFEEHLMKGHTS